MKNKKQVISILGAPGAGKGTQADFLVKNFNLEYIGSGEMLRKRKKKDDFTGNKIAKIIDKGGLLPSFVPSFLWMKRFEEIKNKKDIKGILMDGSPRKLNE